MVGKRSIRTVYHYFPVCESCGRLYVAKAEEYFEEERKVVYFCSGTEAR